VRLGQAAWDDPEVRRLTTAQQEELRARYDGGTAVGFGALRALGGDAAEVERMYVVPAARGRGVSKLLLAGLEDAARGRGWTTLRLETGPRQPEALALYERAGYRPIPAFGAYVDVPDAGCSLYYERVLGPA
jgi:GNAT superfamily N-acetyltransferase